MGTTVRFGVSLDSNLLEDFDALCAKQGYANRSEAIRDLIRAKLVQEEWDEAEHEMAAVLTLVYDHHKGDTVQRITEAQHDAHHLIIATLHVHLDHHNCLEVLILQGQADTIRNTADAIIAAKGVMYGSLSLATTGKQLQ